MLVVELSPEEFELQAREDLEAAVETRRELEEHKLRVYKLYEAWSDKVTGGGRVGEAEGGRGEFGWSKLSVPLIFWIVETELPRLALAAPTLIAAASVPKAVPFQKAKQLRLQRQVKYSGMRPSLFRALKRMSLYGLGPMVWWWNPDNACFQVDDISWFDFFISPDARHWKDAECLWVRSWYTPRQLKALSKRVDRNNRPLYENLEDVIDSSGEPDMADSLWQARRMVHGQGPERWAREGGLFPLYTGYYKDGSIAVLGGTDYRIMVQARPTPYQERVKLAARDAVGARTRPARPIVCLGNTPDTEGPYPIGSGDVVLNYQEEMSTHRRQALDQATAHLNAPVVYDKAALGEDANAKIDAAFGQPGGKLPVNAGQDVRTILMRVPPGQLTLDVQGISELLRQEAQLATGISDYVSGLASQSGMPSNQTATAVNRITDEANMRWRFKNALVEEDMGIGACLVDNMDRQFGGVLMSPGVSGYDVSGAQGITDHGGLLELGVEANGDELEYDVTIETGSMTPAAQSQMVMDLRAFVETAMSVPEMAGMVDWQEVIRDFIEALGFDPERVLLSDDEMMRRAVAAEAQPGENPVGEPQPV